MAEELLAGSQVECLQIDGYVGYNRLFNADGTNRPMTSVRCWAHARRKFHETLKATGSGLAGRVRNMISKLYKIEKMVVGLPAEARLAIRQEKSLPILDEIHAELLRAEGRAHGANSSVVVSMSEQSQFSPSPCGLAAQICRQQMGSIT